MRRGPLTLFFILALALIIQINGAWAQDNGTDLDLSNVDQALGERLNISTFAGGILCTIILCVMFVVPTAMFSKKNIYPPVVVTLLCLGFSSAIQWLDTWFILVPSVLLALMLADKARNFIGG